MKMKVNASSLNNILAYRSQYEAFLKRQLKQKTGDSLRIKK